MNKKVFLALTFLATAFAAGNANALLCLGKEVTINANETGVNYPHTTWYWNKRVVQGTDGDDVIMGSEGVDHIYAGAGNDTICAMGGDDVIRGGSGQDTINGGNGNDFISGDAGSDTINGQGGSDTLYGHSTFGEGWETDWLYGGPGKDTIYGGGGRDYIFGLAGNDFIWGQGGNDILRGGDHKDIMYGGEGSDTIKGEKGSDIIYGESGNDTLEGNKGHDYVYGGLGNDSLFGNESNDTLFGGVGTDSYNGGYGTDICDETDGGSKVRCENLTVTDKSDPGCWPTPYGTIVNCPTPSSANNAKKAELEARRYEMCAVSLPQLILCNDYVPYIEPATTFVLKEKVGLSPGEVWELAASICLTDTAARCQFAFDSAELYWENRNTIAAAYVAGELAPAPPVLNCGATLADGSVSKYEAAKCAADIAF